MQSTDKYNIVYRKGAKEDAPFLASCVLAGIGYSGWALDGTCSAPKGLFEALTHVCGLKDTLYSYKNAILGIDLNSNARVGTVICYDGTRYATLKQATFATMQGSVPASDVSTFGNETGPGEWYIDTLAVDPAFRGHGLGKELLKAVITDPHVGLCPPQDDVLRHCEGDSPWQSIKRITLAVDESHPKVVAIYESIGFRKTGEIVSLFGEDYIKMAICR